MCPSFLSVFFVRLFLSVFFLVRLFWHSFPLSCQRGICPLRPELQAIYVRLLFVRLFVRLLFVRLFASLLFVRLSHHVLFLSVISVSLFYLM